MIDKVRKTVEKYALLERCDSVTVGISGGADSVSLLSVLCELKEEYELNISAVHINHGIRGEEACRDESFVRDFCAERNIPLTVFHENIPLEAEKSGEGEEECGRRIRYRRFNEIANGGKIATAHTLSDSVETMIFNMLRGSSLSGLCGIPEKRENIIRPLIECTREDVESYCKNNGLSFVTDSTNLESDYTRNYIRRELFPMFGRVNQSYMKTLSRLREMISEDSDFLENEAKKLLSFADTGNGLSVERLLTGDISLIKRAFVIYIKNKCGISPENRHIRLLCENLKGSFVLQISSDYFVCIKNSVVFLSEGKEKNVEEEIRIPLITGENSFKSKIIIAEKFSDKDFLKNHNYMLENAVDYDKIIGDIFIRGREQGDTVFLYKRKVTKTLKKLFCEMKIPKEERKKIPVVCDEEKVLWVEGVGVNGVCRVTKETKNILYFRRK